MRCATSTRCISSRCATFWLLRLGWSAGCDCTRYDPPATVHRLPREGTAIGAIGATCAGFFTKWLRACARPLVSTYGFAYRSHYHLSRLFCGRDIVILAGMERAPSPIPTLEQLAAAHRGVGRLRALLAPQTGCLRAIHNPWGPNASSEMLRRSARCTKCGRKGAVLRARYYSIRVGRVWTSGGSLFRRADVGTGAVTGPNARLKLDNRVSACGHNARQRHA
jgi:hypothetical protein